MTEPKFSAASVFRHFTPWRLLCVFFVSSASATVTLPSQPALNPDVTQSTIQETICQVGYTDTVRPSTSYTNRIKFRLMRDAGLEEDQAGEWALDHIIALTLGGHPRQLSNLQLLSSKENGRKSRIEVKLACFVCTGQMSLEDAQHEILEDWARAYRKYSPVKCNRRHN
jgi:cytochrome c-type biogenesis protein CcmH/NrfF